MEILVIILASIMLAACLSELLRIVVHTIVMKQYEKEQIKLQQNIDRWNYICEITDLKRGAQ